MSDSIDETQALADEELPLNVVLPVLSLIVVVFALASFGPKRIMSLIRN